MLENPALLETYIQVRLVTLPSLLNKKKESDLRPLPKMWSHNQAARDKTSPSRLLVPHVTRTNKGMGIAFYILQNTVKPIQ